MASVQQQVTEIHLSARSRRRALCRQEDDGPPQQQRVENVAQQHEGRDREQNGRLVAERLKAVSLETEADVAEGGNRAECGPVQDAAACCRRGRQHRGFQVLVAFYGEIHNSSQQNVRKNLVKEHNSHENRQTLVLQYRRNVSRAAAEYVPAGMHMTPRDSHCQPQMPV